MHAQAKYEAQEGVSLAFKRHILEKTSDFVSEPMSDLYRVQTLGMMLDRYDELLESGLGQRNARQRVLYEFADLAGRMRDMGFEEADRSEPLSRWPQMTEDDAARYIRERDAYTHRIASGVLMCVACLVPLMALCGRDVLLYGFAGDAANVLGLVGMFGMIGMGVYAMVTAVKPKDEKRIKAGRFSLGSHARRKLENLREEITGKARCRKGRGVATIVMSIIPVLVGAMIGEGAYSDAWPLFGVAGMFLMNAVGVYELIVADGEKKTIKRLLDKKE